MNRQLAQATARAEEFKLAVDRASKPRSRVCFVVESGTDVRMVEGMAERFSLTALARQIDGGVEISQPPSQPVPTIVGPRSRLAFALRVWNHLRAEREGIDHVIVQGYGLAALAANLASHLTGRPTTMLVCSPAEAYYRCRANGTARGERFSWLEFGGLKALALINGTIGRRYLVLSRHLADVVHRHGGRTVDIVPIYGVDTQVFTPPRESKAAIKARLGLPTTGSLIFFASRIAPEKDSETLLTAVRSLLGAGRELWLLHRSGGYRSFVREAERFGVARRVIATGAVHPHRELPQDYQASDLCVQSSREEGLGFSPLEALACGVPVIVAAVGGLKETIIEGKTGWTYPVGDSSTLARCIEQVLDRPVEAMRRAAAGRELVCRRFDRRLVFDQLERVIELSSGRGFHSQS